MKPDTADEKQKINERKVRVACIVGIKERLKYPTSMEIKNRSVVNVSENKWIVKIGIRAKNNFNVMVSSWFICTVCLEDETMTLKTIRNN